MFSFVIRVKDFPESGSTKVAVMKSDMYIKKIATITKMNCVNQ